MAVDMHTQTPLPRAPPSAKPVRSKPRIGGVIFHFLSTLAMINGFKGLEHVDIPDELKVVDFSRFLTNWGLFLAIITTTLGTLSNILPSVTFIRNLQRGVLLVALPLEIVISTIYWTLILLAPSLILPTSSATSSTSSARTSGEPSSSTQTPQLFRIPLWIDLSLHAVPAVVLGIEFFIREKKYLPPTSTIGALGVSATFAGCYAGWIEWRALGDGHFPYPFLAADQPLVRGAIYVASTGFAFVAFRFLNGLHR